MMSHNIRIEILSKYIYFYLANRPHIDNRLTPEHRKYFKSNTYLNNTGNILMTSYTLLL